MEQKSCAQVHSLVKFSEDDIGVPGIKLWGRRVYHYAINPVSPHSHDGLVEAIFVTRGEKKYRLGDKEICIRRGQAFLIPPNTEHQGADVYEGSGECYAVHLDPNAEKLLFLCEEGRAQMRGALLDNCGRIIHAGSPAFMLAAQCHQCIERKQTPAYIASAIAHLLNCILSGGCEVTPLDKAVARAMKWIAVRIEEKIELQQLCAELGIAKSTLQHKFSVATGESLQQYIIRQKILTSLDVLRATRSITETAAMFQFAQPGHYSRLFKKHMFVSPREYLSMHPG